VAKGQNCWTGAGGGRCCCPPEAARAVVEPEAASMPNMSSSRSRSLRTSCKVGKVLDYGGLGVEAGNGQDLKRVDDIGEEGGSNGTVRCRSTVARSHSRASATTFCYCHRGLAILTLTGIDEGHDKGKVSHSYIARSNDNRVSDGGGDDRDAQ
jgi:hypothetical protein